MDSYRQEVDFLQGKQPNKNIVTKRPKKDGYTNTSHIKQKEEEQVKCSLTLCLFEEEDEWYIDSGCSSHMTGDQDKFISLKRKGGNVAFGDDSSAKILGEGVVELGRKNVKSKNVLLVEDLNHNLLSVSKMCDQGYTLTFDSRKCKIR